MEFLTDHISITPNRPFFLYLAFGAQHEPHQVPKEFIEKYEGVYDKGWDQIREERFERQKKMGVIPPFTELVELTPGIKAWDELTAKEKSLFIKFQQTYAGFLTHTDQQIGRLLHFLEEKNKLDDTIIVLLSDNGGSQEGGWNGSINDSAYFNGIEENIEVMFDHIDEIEGPLTSPNYPKGWVQVSNTPFKYYKQDTFYGGTHVPLIIHCPQRISDPGSIRSQFYHAIDITPTICLIDMMNLPAQLAFGKKKRDTLPTVCKNCDVRFACHGECPKHRFLVSEQNEPGLNYLCASYKNYFKHIHPYMIRMKQLLQAGLPASNIKAMMMDQADPSKI
jgi:arylsulfatase